MGKEKGIALYYVLATFTFPLHCWWEWGEGKSIRSLVNGTTDGGS